mmetsp:Transcript_31152/g.41572  ORF Transcript_31152/g.41572 Transcript_31152/m.41572 type:complete len:214 (-) Transcript_31152:1660-2301(-)
MEASKVVFGGGVHTGGLGLAKFIDQNSLCIWTIHSIHSVVDQGKIITVKKSFDGIKIKDGLEKSNVCLGGGNHFNSGLGTSILTLYHSTANLANVDLGEVRTDVVAFDCGGVCVNFVRYLFWGRSAIFTIVLDTKVLFWSTGVVTGCEDKCTVSFLPNWAALTDNGRNSRGRKKTILANPKTLHTIGYTHLDNGLDCCVIEVTSITTNNKRTL